MVGKPFSIQAPEAIAKEYGGNKQKIAQAVQSGLLDPTSGVLAGMFIDRMRSAQMVEQSQAPTVAQQVLAPRPPVAPGMMPPGMGAPQAPPAAGLGAMAPQGAPQMPQGPGMADGGFVPPYASGGLDGLPVPDTMFDENRNGGFDDGYAGGGIVAFAEAGPVETQPGSYYGYYRDPEEQRRQIAKFYQPKTAALDELNAYYQQENAPAALEKRRKQDMWATLGQIGATMATTPGSFLQSLGAGLGAALPAAQAAAKERRAEKIDFMKTMAQNERMSNKDALDMYNLVQQGTDKYGEFDQKRLDRAQQEKLERIKGDYGIREHQISAAATTGAARISAKGYTDYQDKELLKARISALRESAKGVDAVLKGDLRYAQAVAKGDQATAQKLRQGAQASLYNQMTGEQMSYDKNGRMIINIGGQWVYPE